MQINYVVNGDEVIISRQTFNKLKRYIEELEKEIEGLQEHIDVIEEENSVNSLYHLE